jgi:soluble lytic murein transglycosylase-like protein
MTIAWGAKVSAEFLARVRQIAGQLGIDPSWLMACMAFESGETFSPSVRNAAGSGAVGLIQFMPSTAAALGTSTDALAAMSDVDQLLYVGKYFFGWAKRLHNLGDVYGVILWPGMVGKPDDYVLFDRADAAHPKRYAQNAGLDFNRDG